MKRNHSTTGSNETEEFQFKTCYARFSPSQLIVGNEMIERTWTIRNGLLYPASIINKMNGMEWLAKEAPYAVAPDFPMQEELRSLNIKAESAKLSPVSEEGLHVLLESAGEQSVNCFEVWTFPASSAVLQQLHAKRRQGSNEEASSDCLSVSDDIELPPSGREGSDSSNHTFNEVGCMDFLELAPMHVMLRQVEFWDQTDSHNELVFEREWLLHPNEKKLRLHGNVFVLENPLDRTGLVLIKHAALPHVRPIPNECDLLVTPGSAGFSRKAGDPTFDAAHPRYPLAYRCCVQGHGTGNAGGAGDRYAVIAYAGGRSGMTAALHTYQRQWRGFIPERDVRLVSNTWGDRSRDSRIQESFMLAEVEAGARLGVDVIQIDDGWQKGRTANSVHAGGVWEGFWANDELYWEPDPARFPNGLEPIIQAAKEKGLLFGLWFAPDSSGEFSNWERDAAKILELYRKGVSYFKIDGVKAFSKQGEYNLNRFFDTVLEKSKGEVVFDLDVTAEIRPGYWGLMQTGPLFVENRYTDFHRYWPHQTLRNLWTLAQYIDPVRLRMEWLNQDRNADLYAGDPLAPNQYPPAYLFAVTMMANPLGWFEVSQLPSSYFENAAPLIDCWKNHREKLYQGRLLPVGEQPDGASWTGFVSVTGGGKENYLLVFRENHPAALWSHDLPCLEKSVEYDVDILYGQGSLHIQGQVIHVEIPSTKQFIFARTSIRK